MAIPNASKNIIYNTTLTICQFLFPLITFPYLARILMPSGLGTVNFLDNIVQYLLFISALGVPIYGTREIAKAKGDKQKTFRLFNELLSINVYASVVTILVYFSVLYIGKDRIQNLNLYFLAGIIIFLSSFSIEWFFQGMGEFPYITKRSLLVKAISIILIFALVKSPADILYYYLITCISYSTTAIINIRYAKKKYDLTISFVLSWNRLKNHMKPIWLIFSANFAISIYLYVDSFLLGLLKGTTAVGFYLTAVKLIKIPISVLGAYINALIPDVSSAFKTGDSDAIKAILDRSFTYVIFLCIPLAIGIFLSSEFLIMLIAGEKYRNSILALKTMSPVIVTLSISNIFIWLMITPASKERYFIFAVVFGMIISIILNAILISKFSYLGTSISTVITETVICSSYYILSKNVFKHNFQLSLVFKSLIASLPMIIVFYFTQKFISNLYISHSVFITISVISYLGIQFGVFKSSVLKEFTSKLGIA